jgi:23S rRNA (adenine2030-N6)-methyltransferase
VNYRHAFHAGNFADVMKHAFLARIVAHLLKKDAPFRIVDTHAGAGLYDLAGDEAERTGEWRGGVGRMAAPFAPEIEALLAPYSGALARTRERFGAHAYPGSPLLIASMLRPHDRGVFVELHPDDASALAGRLGRRANIKVLELDGWTALKAFIPPKERRGLVLVDPPYEEKHELERLAMELKAATAKWPTGMFAAWYPIKDTAEVEAAAASLEGATPRGGLRLELFVHRPNVPTRLNGSGLFVLNPPWTLEDEAALLLPALADRLAAQGYGAYRCERLGAAR